MTDFEYEVDAIIESYISEFEPVHELSDERMLKAAYKARDLGKAAQYQRIKDMYYLKATRPKGVSGEELARRRREGNLGSAKLLNQFLYNRKMGRD